MKDIGVVVAGAGFIGPVHVEALRRLGMPIRGILGIDLEESEAARANLGLPHAYGSFDEVLSDPTVRAVHLAVPNVMHYEFSRRALLAGKHVMCEKPLAMNAEELGTDAFGREKDKALYGNLGAQVYGIENAS